MKFWNKETRNADGDFYRSADWAVERPDDWTKPNFTTVEPLTDSLGNIVKQDWDEQSQAWVADTTYTTDEQRKNTLRDLIEEMPVNEIALTMLDQFLALRTAGTLVPTARMGALLDKWQAIKDKYTGA